MKAITTLVLAYLIVSSLAGHIELSEEQKAKGKVHFNECIKKENVSPGDTEKLRKKDLTNPSHSMTCFAACGLEKLGVLVNNELKVEAASQVLKPLIGEEKTMEVVNKCKDSEGSDRCATGLKTYQCLQTLDVEF